MMSPGAVANGSAARAAQHASGHRSGTPRRQTA